MTISPNDRFAEFGRNSSKDVENSTKILEKCLYYILSHILTCFSMNYRDVSVK